jgi:hypothetical protein
MIKLRKAYGGVTFMVTLITGNYLTTSVFEQ